MIEESQERPVAELLNAAEAILIVAEGAVSESELAAALQITEEAACDLIKQLQMRYQDHGFELRRVAGGVRFYSRDKYDADVTRFLQGQRSTKLSQAALETLAVIAYRQPVTRAAVSAIRGVSVDGVCRTLEAHGLIERDGQNESGATLWVTTPEFLGAFGLLTLEELPPLAPHLPDMEQLDDVIERLEARSDGSA